MVEWPLVMLGVREFPWRGMVGPWQQAGLWDVCGIRVDLDLSSFVGCTSICHQRFPSLGFLLPMPGLGLQRVLT